MPFFPGGHVGLRVFKLLVGKCTHTRFYYCFRKYGDGHLNQVSILTILTFMSNLRLTTSYIMAVMLVFDLWWSMGIFHYLI